MDASNGSAVWAVSVGGTSYDYGYGITSVGLDRVAVTGYFNSGSATFGDVVITSKGDYDAFIAMVSVCTLCFAIN